MQACYSFDNRDFTYTSLSELRDGMADVGLLKIGATYFEGVARKPDFTELLCLDSVLEDMNSNAVDLAGESAEDFAYGISVGAKNELETLILGWMEKHLDVNFYTVDDISARKLSAEDMAPHAANAL